MCEGDVIGNLVDGRERCIWDQAAGTWVRLVQYLPGTGL